MHISPGRRKIASMRCLCSEIGHRHPSSQRSARWIHCINPNRARLVTCRGIQRSRWADIQFHQSGQPSPSQGTLSVPSRSWYRGGVGLEKIPKFFTENRRHVGVKWLTGLRSLDADDVGQIVAWRGLTLIPERSRDESTKPTSRVKAGWTVTVLGRERWVITSHESRDQQTTKSLLKASLRHSVRGVVADGGSWPGSVTSTRWDASKQIVGACLDITLKRGRFVRHSGCFKRKLRVSRSG